MTTVKDAEYRAPFARLGAFPVRRYGGSNESRDRLGDLAAVRTAFRRMQTSLYAN